MTSRVTEEIEDYDPKTSRIVDLEGAWAHALFDGDLPEYGEAVAVDPDGATAEPVYGVVRTHEGGRRVRLMFAGRPGSISTGCEVERTERPAWVTRPEHDVLELKARSLVPADHDEAGFPLSPEQPAFSELSPSRAPIASGWEPLDTFAPLVRGGFNLVIEADPDRSQFDGLAERLHDRADVDASMSIAPAPAPESASESHVRVVPSEGDHGRFVALRVGTGRAAHFRDEDSDVLVVAELPVPRERPTRSTEMSSDPEIPSIGGVIDRMASRLVSTRRCEITSLVRLPVGGAPDGLEAIIETLDLGDVDAQIFFDREGAFQPRRSTSDADIDDETREQRQTRLDCLRRAEQLRDKARIMGDVALTERESELLERAEAIRERSSTFR